MKKPILYLIVASLSVAMLLSGCRSQTHTTNEQVESNILADQEVMSHLPVYKRDEMISTAEDRGILEVIH